jgi:hypothetical protein
MFMAEGFRDRKWNLFYLKVEVEGLRVLCRLFRNLFKGKKTLGQRRNLLGRIWNKPLKMMTDLVLTSVDSGWSIEAVSREEC